MMGGMAFMGWRRVQWTINNTLLHIPGRPLYGCVVTTDRPPSELPGYLRLARQHGVQMPDTNNLPVLNDYLTQDRVTVAKYHRMATGAPYTFYRGCILIEDDGQIFEVVYDHATRETGP